MFMRRTLRMKFERQYLKQRLGGLCYTMCRLKFEKKPITSFRKLYVTNNSFYLYIT